MSTRDDFARWSDEGGPQLTICSYDALVRALDEIDRLAVELGYSDDIARCRGEENERLRSSVTKVAGYIDASPQWLASMGVRTPDEVDEAT